MVGDSMPHRFGMYRGKDHLSEGSQVKNQFGKWNVVKMQLLYSTTNLASPKYFFASSMVKNPPYPNPKRQRLKEAPRQSCLHNVTKMRFDDILAMPIHISTSVLALLHSQGLRARKCTQKLYFCIVESHFSHADMYLSS